MPPDRHGLPLFLSLLTNSREPLSMTEAMQAASKLVPHGLTTYDTLKGTTEHQLVAAGFSDTRFRRKVHACLRHLRPPVEGFRRTTFARPEKSRESMFQEQHEAPERDLVASFEFDPIFHMDTLRFKSALVNRAPLMCAWATVVAERLGFRRGEALSLAQCYTQLNAQARARSLGIDTSDAPQGVSKSQPFVDLMGRQIPVICTQVGRWKALDPSGTVIEPHIAYTYITRSLRQQTGAVLGALSLLADAYAPEELNACGYDLYTRFRPDVPGYGKKGMLRVSSICDLVEEKKGGTSGEGDTVERNGGTSAEGDPLEKKGGASVEGDTVDKMEGTSAEGDPLEKKGGASVEGTVEKKRGASAEGTVERGAPRENVDPEDLPESPDETSEPGNEKQETKNDGSGEKHIETIIID